MMLMQRNPLILLAILFFIGHNRDVEQVSASLGCHDEMGEHDGILSVLQQEQESSYAKTYLITGATSGIGLEAAKMLAIMNPMNRLIVVGRNERSSRMAAKEVASVLPNQRISRDHIIPIACDHSNFGSVRKFSIELRRKLDETYDKDKWAMNGVDVLCLNAAMLQPNNMPAQFTRDELEITFQTNHLSPFLLVNLIHRMLNPGGRVIVSTSGLYLYQTMRLEGIQDPTTGKARTRFETADGAEYNCKKSYAFTKLCNVAMAVELHERLKALGVAVICFSPGLITQTGLFRHHRDAHPIKFPKDLMLNEKTVLWGAGALAFMATSRKVGQSGGSYWHDPDSGKGPCAIYGEDFHSDLISKKQIKTADSKKLWSLSSELTGISEDMIPLARSPKHKRISTPTA